MRFLVDAALSYVLADLLAAEGHDAVHVRAYNMTKAPDIEIFERAVTEDRIIISVDTDFSALLALTNSAKPSVILLRWPTLRRAEEQAAIAHSQAFLKTHNFLSLNSSSELTTDNRPVSAKIVAGSGDGHLWASITSTANM